MQQQSKILREKRVFGGAETVDSERQCTSKKSTRGKIHARRIAYNAKESSGDKYSASYLSKKPVIDLTPVKIVKQRTKQRHQRHGGRMAGVGRGGEKIIII